MRFKMHLTIAHLGQVQNHTKMNTQTHIDSKYGLT
jgi:hypothetical protein